MIFTKITGTGSCFPRKVLTNFDLSKMVDTSNEWILERTGIRERHIIDKSYGESTSQLAYEASLKALKSANKTAADIDFILLATASGDYPLPTTSCLLQEKLGAKRTPALDIAAACSGFVYGLSLANALIKTQQYRTILLVGADVLSGITDWTDRNTCILFGDGAGALILEPSFEANSSQIYSCHLYADGTLKDTFHLPAGGTAIPASEETVQKRMHFMKMQGREIYKVAVRMLADAAIEALEKNGFALKDLDWFIPHQANLRIIEAVAKRIGFPMDRVIINIDRYGNTSSASIPTAFDEAILQGRVKRGDLILFDVFGAGLTWGSALLRY